MNCTFKGEKAIKLQGSTLSVTILPDRGSKLVSIVDLASGSELLWQYPGEVYPPLVAGGTFTEADGTGFDDMFPAITASLYGIPPWEKSLVSDHGEVWSRPWKVMEAGPTEVVLEFEGLIFPYKLRKRVNVESSLRISYELENTGDSVFQWIWAAHPLFTAGPATTYIPLSGEREIPSAQIINANTNFDLPGYGSRYSFPDASVSAMGAKPSYTLAIDSMGLKEDKAFALKYWFADCGRFNGALIDDPAQDFRLKVTWDSKVLSWLGIWINSGGWAGHQNLAIEPASAPMDSFERARNLAQQEPGAMPPVLKPGKRVGWFLEIAVQKRS